MASEKEYERPYQRNEPDFYKTLLQNMFAMISNQCMLKK